MDLPPDKVKLLRQYDDEKKWDLICDQVTIVILASLCSSTPCLERAQNADTIERCATKESEGGK